MYKAWPDLRGDEVKVYSADCVTRIAFLYDQRRTNRETHIAKARGRHAARRYTFSSPYLFSLRFVELFFADHCFALVWFAGAMGCAKHGAASGCDGSEAHESDGLRHIVVDGFHAALHEIGLVPEAGAAGVAQEILPPFTMGLGARPGKKCFRIAPVLAHAGMHGKERENKVLVQQQAIRRGVDRVGDLRPEAEECLQTGEAIDAHTEIDDDEVGILRQIHGLTIDLHGHKQQTLVNHSVTLGS